MKFPYLQFYTGDWLKDPAVGLCSPATRGIWLDALCLMHEKDQCGQLQGTLLSLSRVCRCTLDDMRQAVTELRETETADVGDVNGCVTLINRRMKKLFDERKSNNERQLRHVELKRNGGVTDLSRSNNATYLKGQSLNSELKVQSLEPPAESSEKELLDWGQRVMGSGVMGRDGGKWTNRIRENPKKFWRLMAAIANDLKEGKKILKMGGFAEKHWKIMHDQLPEKL